MAKEICIISQRYPAKFSPSVHVFVKKLAHALADQGVRVHVITPVSRAVKEQIEEVEEEKTANGNKVLVYRPRYFYAGERKLGFLYLSHISANQMERAAIKMMEKYHIKADAFYGHFICVAGICACRLGKKYRKPAYIGYGESTDWSIKNFNCEKIKREVNSNVGFIAVSSENKKRLLEHGITDEENIRVFVNGIDEKLFHKRDRKDARKELNFPQEDFIVSFVGQFCERKVVLRLNQAIQELPDDIKAAYAGSGKEKPEGKKILLAQSMEPEKIPVFLSASDIFVLPTRNEGCCNAVLEALACGIPVVSSDREFNYDVLDQECAILINPDSVQDIKTAILELKENKEKRNRMSEQALKKAKQLTMEKRADGILRWMEERGNGYEHQ